MSPQTTLEVRLAIDTINAEFSWSLDNASFENLDHLFEEDAFYQSGERVLRGRGEIRTFFEKRRALGPRSSRHMWSGLRIVSLTEDMAQTTSVWLSFAANAPLPLQHVPIFMVADFFDLYKRGNDGQWRIAERRIVGTFRNPDAAPLI
ncbi:nuclear transport factor 2 family protein [Paraburkholderia sp. B3]|uniref:nuclear transport factor 2 family protein n=1 Tax=Paraburkholderia sp. B3 TaxID=3134791 RepID=UPI0039821A38